MDLSLNSVREVMSDLEKREEISGRARKRSEEYIGMYLGDRKRLKAKET